MSQNPAQNLKSFGQSIWYDNISRSLIQTGELKRLISDWGVRGVTSNPSIFNKAISEGKDYQDFISSLKAKSLDSSQIFEEIAVRDVGEAADLFLPVYEESDGEDGFVSIEVSPLLASDTKGSITEAKRLHQKLNRPNIMIKIPGTKEGIPAIKSLLLEGISVNVTLLFSVENYIEVAETYVSALSERAEQGLPLDKIRSVASFFVSRVDSALDKAIDGLELGDDEKASLKGKFAIANSKLAYKEFLEIFEKENFSQLKSSGAHVQRPLWASTSTKNPTYSDVLYVDELIGPDTVNTLPHNTLEAFVDHGTASDTLAKGMNDAEALKQKLLGLSIDIGSHLEKLQVDGVKAFADSFVELNETINKA